MTERSLIPFALGFTPSEGSAQPSLNLRQQKELSDIIRRYGVSLTDREVVRRVSGVAGDAILRALGEKSQSSFSPKDRLIPLFRRGLEIRENLRTRAEAYLNLSIYNQNTYSDLAGPLALPTSLINAANANQRVFALTADLTAIQQVVQLGEERLALVDPLASLALAALAPTMGEVSLNRFPTPQEKVKIIRNMIASFIFRGNLSPQISVADLREFVIKAPSFFSEEAKEALLEQLQADTPQKKSYLEDLYTQTREPFRLYTTVPADDNPQGIEDFYNRYARDLRLMHPWREEEQIITNPQKIKEGRLSMWDNPIIIEGFNLPRSELLSQALRQAQTRHDTYTAENLKAGINIWIWFEGAKKAHIAKIKSAEENLAERTQLYSDILNPDFPLPKEAYFIRYTFQSQARAAAFHARKESERLGELIKNMQAKQKEAVFYEQSLNDQYGENWPEVIEIPRSAFLEGLLEEKKKLGNKNRVTNKQLSALEELMAIDFFWNKQDRFSSGILRKDRRKAKTRVTKELETTKQILSQPSIDENLFSPEEFSAEELRDHLTPYFRKKRALGLPASLKPFYKFWEDVYRKVVDEIFSSGVVKQTEKKLDFKKALPQILKHRAQLLQDVLQTLEEKDRLLKQQKDVQIRYEEASDVKQPLTTEASWSRNEAKSYIKEMEASKMPSLKGVTLDELAKASIEMGYFIDRYAVAVLPDRVMSKETLESWINTQVDRISHLRLDVKSKNYQGYLNYFKRMLSYMNNPLVPLPEENSTRGIGKNSFLRAWRRRVDFAYAICYKARVLKKSQEASEKYDLIMRDTFQESLSRELQSKERELDKLRSRNLEEELLKKMRNHNLVLENPSNAN